MRILLTNDDGIHAPGLRAVRRALNAAGHEVVAVAPMSEQSGVSASLTIHKPLRVEEVEEDGFTGLAVSGSPVDCVKIALSTLLQSPPDLVVAGLNNGGNLGADIFYSGTVAAASEAALLGVPSVALSRCRPQGSQRLRKGLIGCSAVSDDEGPEPCAGHAANLISRMDWAAFPRFHVLNVNYPRCRLAETRGIRVGRMTLHPWNDGYERREDPFGCPYWWLSGYVPPGSEEDTDVSLVQQGWISLTPLLCDRTSLAAFDALSRLVLPGAME